MEARETKIIDFGLSGLSFDGTFEAFQRAQKIRTVLFQRLRLGLAPHWHQFIDDLARLNGKTFRLPIFNRNGYLPITHPGLIFLRNKSKKLEHDSLTALNVLGT